MLKDFPALILKDESGRYWIDCYLSDKEQSKALGEWFADYHRRNGLRPIPKGVNVPIPVRARLTEDAVEVNLGDGEWSQMDAEVDIQELRRILECNQKQ